MFSILKLKEEDISKLCLDFEVEVLYVFGSAARGEISLESDIDFLVRFRPHIALLDFANNFFGFQEKLENLLNRNIDLLPESSLKNPVFKKEVYSTRIPIYEKQSA